MRPLRCANRPACERRSRSANAGPDAVDQTGGWDSRARSPPPQRRRRCATKPVGRLASGTSRRPGRRRNRRPARCRPLARRRQGPSPITPLSGLVRLAARQRDPGSPQEGSAAPDRANAHRIGHDQQIARSDAVHCRAGHRPRRAHHHPGHLLRAGGWSEPLRRDRPSFQARCRPSSGKPHCRTAAVRRTFGSTDRRRASGERRDSD